MTPFRFRLDRLLDLRTAVDREQARSLSDALHREAEQRRLTDESQARLEHASTRVAAQSACGDALHAGVLQAYALTVRAASARADADRRALSAAEQARADEQDKLSVTRRERRTLERLKEHAREAWRMEAGRAEQKIMDEVALRRPGLGGEAA